MSAASYRTAHGLRCVAAMPDTRGVAQLAGVQRTRVWSFKSRNSLFNEVSVNFTAIRQRVTQCSAQSGLACERLLRRDALLSRDAAKSAISGAKAETGFINHTSTDSDAMGDRMGLRTQSGRRKRRPGSPRRMF